MNISRPALLLAAALTAALATSACAPEPDPEPTPVVTATIDPSTPTAAEPTPTETSPADGEQEDSHDEDGEDGHEDLHGALNGDPAQVPDEAAELQAAESASAFVEAKIARDWLSPVGSDQWIDAAKEHSTPELGQTWESARGEVDPSWAQLVADQATMTVEVTDVQAALAYPFDSSTFVMDVAYRQVRNTEYTSRVIGDQPLQVMALRMQNTPDGWKVASLDPGLMLGS